MVLAAMNMFQDFALCTPGNSQMAQGQENLPSDKCMLGFPRNCGFNIFILTISK